MRTGTSGLASRKTFKRKWQVKTRRKDTTSFCSSRQRFFVFWFVFSLFFVPYFIFRKWLYFLVYNIDRWIFLWWHRIHSRLWVSSVRRSCCLGSWAESFGGIAGATETYIAIARRCVTYWWCHLNTEKGGYPHGYGNILWERCSRWKVFRWCRLGAHCLAQQDI